MAITLREIALLLACAIHRSLGYTRVVDERRGQASALKPTRSFKSLLLTNNPASALASRSTSMPTFKPLSKSRCTTVTCNMVPKKDIVVPAEEVQQELNDKTHKKHRVHVKAQMNAAVIEDAKSNIVMESLKNHEDIGHETHEQQMAHVQAQMNAAVIGDAKSKVVMTHLKNHEGNSAAQQDMHEQHRAHVQAQMNAAIIGDGNSKIEMERLKNQEDESTGITALLGNALLLIDPTKTVRRRLWTRADFMHIHAVSGAYFLSAGPLWLIYSHIVNALDTSVPMETSSPFLTSLLLAGLANALSAVPMSKFTSNKNLDLKDLKANGFTFGGTGLTIMCLYIAWWFSGDYPDILRAFDVPIFFFWAFVCAGTTANWEVMLQKNYEANEAKSERRKVSQDELNKKAFLYRIASWPNLTQLLFMYSIPFGGLAWLQQVQEIWPMQSTPLYHYGIVSAMGYALSMLGETLRDRKLITLDQDLVILLCGFILPMVSVVIDGLTYGSAVTINPLEYWTLFGAVGQ